MEDTLNSLDEGQTKFHSIAIEILQRYRERPDGAFCEGLPVMLYPPIANARFQQYIFTHSESDTYIDIVTDIGLISRATEFLFIFNPCEFSRKAEMNPTAEGKALENSDILRNQKSSKQTYINKLPIEGEGTPVCDTIE